MDFFNGTMLLYCGFFMLFLSVVLLIVFIHSEKKKNNTSDVSLQVKKDTTVLLHNPDETYVMQTELVENEDMSTAPFENEQTEMIENEDTATIPLEDEQTEIMNL